MYGFSNHDATNTSKKSNVLSKASNEIAKIDRNVIARRFVKRFRKSNRFIKCWIIRHTMCFQANPIIKRKHASIFIFIQLDTEHTSSSKFQLHCEWLRACFPSNSNYTCIFAPLRYAIVWRVVDYSDWIQSVSTKLFCCWSWLKNLLKNCSFKWNWGWNWFWCVKATFL